MKENFNVVRKRYPKIEALEKATGSLKYCGDLQFPNMLYAKILRSPFAHARIKRIDTSRATNLRGVKAVITHDDIPNIPTMHQFLHLPSILYYDSFLLENKVRHYGDRVAAVAAESPDVAEEALKLIKVDYEPLPAVFDLMESGTATAPTIHSNAWKGGDPIEIKNNIVDVREANIGDVQKGFQESDLIIENTFKTSKPNPAPLERTVVTCVPGPNGSLDIYGTTQSIHAMRKNIASSLGIPLHKITCHWTYLGGSFGAHIHTGWIEPISAFLALRTNRPVRGEKTREEMFLAYGRHPMVIRLKTGVKKDGTLIAMEVDITDDTGAYAFSGASKMALASGFCLSMYVCPNQRVVGRTVYTNTPPLTAMRGAGNPQAHWAVESQMDIIAERLNIDPIELRLKNHIGIGECFYGQSVDVICDVQSCGTEELIQKGAEAIGWPSREKNDTEKPWIKRGVGMARGFHTSGAGSPEPSPFIMDYSGAIIKMNEDGTALVMNASADAGGGNRSAYVAMVAEELGLRYEDVILDQGNTNTTLFDVPTHASRGTYGTGLAILQAAKKVKQKLFEWASELLEAPINDLVAELGSIYVTGSPEKKITIEDLIETAQIKGWGSAIGEASVRPKACPPHFTVCFVEVLVDTQTGKVEVVKAVSGADVGTPINLNNVEGQVEGGIHMGLGFALYEDTKFDPETGELLNPGFLDYKMLTFSDMPPVQTIIADTYEPTGPFGAKGVGEGVTNPVAPAVANAIFNAIGIRIKDLPITAEKIMKALAEKKTK
ncbi:MAG: xanthine dehydrogenase family protein molybdopterin-binding subunit [Desulfobacterales bacterium]|nr:MAG: xanthine dehydrogenase family protein molybdopterin-binding subunit [Desulfobacterales bacterium]